MSFYSDYLATGKHQDGHTPAISDRVAIIFALVSVAVLVTVLIGGSRLLLTLL
jgi:hypothetical protein